MEQEKESAKDIISKINKLSYKDKFDVYQSCFSMGYVCTKDMNDRLVLISLVSLTYQKMKEKDKSITPLALLLKITGEKDTNSSFYSFLEALSIIVEDISFGIEKIDACGMKTSNEIIKKIKELLNTWIPF